MHDDSETWECIVSPIMAQSAKFNVVRQKITAINKECGCKPRGHYVPYSAVPLQLTKWMLLKLDKKFLDDESALT